MTKDLSDLQGNDIIDVRDIIARVEELRDQRTDRWVAGWNMPGYMPDNTPEESSDCDDARQHLADEMEDAASCKCDQLDNDDSLTGTMRNKLENQVDDLEEARTELERMIEEDPEAEYGNTVGGMHYFISKDGVMGLDEDETKELVTLEEVLDDLKGYGGDERWEGDWYPVTLVREGYFEDFARDEAEQLDLIKKDASWPNNHIDWEAAAKDLRQDYSEVEFDGTTYLYRG